MIEAYLILANRIYQELDELARVVHRVNGPLLPQDSDQKIRICI